MIRSVIISAGLWISRWNTISMGCISGMTGGSRRGSLWGRIIGVVSSSPEWVQHSCGDCHEIFPDLIEIGLDCYQTFQPEIYDIEKMKDLYGGKLAFWGGVSTQQCLPYASPDGVRAEAVRIMKALRRDGGLIIAPTHALPFDVPPENILALLDVFRNQERYL